MKLTLVTPEKKLFTDLVVDEIVVPAHTGQLNVLPNHAPIVTTLGTGVFSYKPEGDSSSKEASISWGYLEVQGDKATVLAETAETPDEIDLPRVEKSIEDAKLKLEGGDLSPEDTEFYQRKLLKGLVRQKLSGN